MSKPRLDFSDSKSTLSGDNELLSTTSTQSVEFTADSVLIKKERLGEGKHGNIFKGERVSMYSELGIQPVLINEINLSENPKQGIQFFHERVSAPILGFSKNSPHIAKCFGFHFNSKGTKVWLVTEFLPYSVHDLIESGPLEEQQIAFIVAEVIRGLAYLHSLEIRHGNVVSNLVMLTTSGEVKLAGFHLAADTLDAVQTLETEDGSFKGDILSLGKMAVELVHGPQISGEHPLVEEESPSLVNQLSKNFRNVITSCLQKDPNDRPTAAQLLNHPFVKKMKKTSLKDHKLLFNRCKRFKRSLARRKTRNYVQSKNITRQPSKSSKPTLRYEEASGDSSCSDSLGSVTHIHPEIVELSETGTSKASDLLVVTWDFRYNSLVQAQESRHNQRDQFTLSFQTIMVTFEEKIYKNTTSAERIYKGTIKDGDQESTSCLVREVDLNKLPKDAAIALCHEVVSPLFQIGSSNVVKILCTCFSRGLNSEAHQEGARLYIVTEFFLDSIHDLQDIGPLEEDLIAWILREILKGLDYLHSQRIAYGNMTSKHILFSIDSGSLEIKLDHSHTVRDELDDRKISSVTTSNFDLASKADIWNLGIIATELVHATPTSNDFSHPTEEPAPILPSQYSKSFSDFVASCLHSSTQMQPTAHELLQSQFIKEAKEMCGLEGVFELCWKLKLKKDRQLQCEVTNDLESDLMEDNVEEDVQVLPSVSWSFDKVFCRLPDEPQSIALPQTQPQSSTSDLNLNETENVSKPQELMSENHQMTEKSTFTQQTESELSSHDGLDSAQLQQQQGDGVFQSLPTPGAALNSGQQPAAVHTRTKHRLGHSQQHPFSPRLSFHGHPPPPPHFQAMPWWMYPPWWLPPPWWLHPPPHPQPPPPPPPPPSQPMASSGQHGNVNPSGQGFYPRPPWWQYPLTTHHTPAHPMGERQLRPPQPNQMGSQLWWSFPPHAWAPWQNPQQQPPAHDGQLHGHTSMESRHNHLLNQPRGEDHRSWHQLQESQDQLPFKQPTAAAEYRPQPENVLSKHLHSTVVTDDHPVLQMELETKELPPLLSRVEEGFPPQASDSHTQEFPQTAADHQLRYEDVLTQHLSLLQSTVDADHLEIDDNPSVQSLQLQPSAGDPAQEVTLVQEMPLLESAVHDNLPVHEEVTFPLEGEQSRSTKEEGTLSPELLPEETRQRFEHRVDQIEQFTPQPTLDKHMLYGEEPMAAGVEQSTIDDHPRHYKDLKAQKLQLNDEIQPSQPLYQEQPLPQIITDDILLQSKSQEDHDKPELAQNEDPLAKKLQSRADDHAVLQDDSESEVSRLLQPKVDDYPWQQGDQSIKESQPIRDDHGVENEHLQYQGLLQSQLEELAPPMSGDYPPHRVTVEESQQTVDDHPIEHEVEQDKKKDSPPQNLPLLQSATADHQLVQPYYSCQEDILGREQQAAVDLVENEVHLEELPATEDFPIQGDNHPEQQPSSPTVDDPLLGSNRQTEQHTPPPSIDSLLLLQSQHQLEQYPSLPADHVLLEDQLEQQPSASTTDGLNLPSEDQQGQLPSSPTVDDVIPADYNLPTKQADDELEKDPSLSTAADHGVPVKGEDQLVLEQCPPPPTADDLWPQHEDHPQEYQLSLITNSLRQQEEDQQEQQPPLPSDDIVLIQSKDQLEHQHFPPSCDESDDRLEQPLPLPLMDNVQLQSKHLPTADLLPLGGDDQLEAQVEDNHLPPDGLHPEPKNQLRQHPLLLPANDLQIQSKDHSLLMTASILLQTGQQVEQLPPPPTDEDLYLQGEEEPEQTPPSPLADDLPLQTDDEPEEHPPQPPEDSTSIESEDQLQQHSPLLPVTDILQVQSQDQTEQPPLSPPAEYHPQHHEQPEMREAPLMGDGHPSQYQEQLLLQGRDQHSPQPVEEEEENYYTLRDLVKVKPLEELQAAAILLKVVQILDHLHSQGKAHNNVTIANIVLSESGEVKLADSNVIESVLAVVPEAKQFTDDDHKADIWSLGITAVEMANGEPPDANMLELLFANSFITPQFLDDDEFSEKFQDFISSCLKLDPEERLSSEELLEHEFLTSANTDAYVVANILISQYKDCCGTPSHLLDSSIPVHPSLLTPEYGQVQKMDLLSKEEQPGDAVKQPGDDIEQPQQEGRLNVLPSQAVDDDLLPNPPHPLSTEDQVEHEHSLVHASDDSPTPKQEELFDQNLLLSPQRSQDLQLQSGNNQLESYPPQLTFDEDQAEHENPVVEEEKVTIDPDHEILKEDSLLEEVLTLLDQSMAADDQSSKHDDLMVEESETKTWPSGLLQEAEVGVDQISDHHLVDNQSSQSMEERVVTHNEYSLQELIRAHPLRETQAAAILLKVVQILDNLHSQGKVHNDVTIANIILTESGAIKLVKSKCIDSVLSMVSEDSQLREDDKTDIWSLGITAVEMANGEPPDANMLELLFANSFVTPQFLDDEVYSDEFEDFISSCLKSDPDERSSAEELMEHEFLTSASPDTVEINNSLITLYQDWRKSQLATDDGM